MKVAIHALSNFQNRKLSRQQREETDMEHNILLTTIRGPIDYATVKAIAQVRARCFDELDVTRIASIVIFQGSMRITPEALDLFSHVMRNHKAQSDKSLFVAYVAEPDIEDRSATCKLAHTIFTENNVRWQAFEKLEEAQAWARTMVSGKVTDAAQVDELPGLSINSN
jgi:hypothetical protein